LAIRVGFGLATAVDTAQIIETTGCRVCRVFRSDGLSVQNRGKGNDHDKLVYMAQVQLDEVIDHLSVEVKGALRDAFNEVLPGVNVNVDAFYRSFKKNVYRRCSVWEQVPDTYVTR
jgi:hypothetical protein